jgi:uncharacterized protein YxeA
MKKLMALLIVIIVTITVILSSNYNYSSNMDNSKNYAGVPPVKVPPIPPIRDAR